MWLDSLVTYYHCPRSTPIPWIPWMGNRIMLDYTNRDVLLTKFWLHDYSIYWGAGQHRESSAVRVQCTRTAENSRCWPAPQCSAVHVMQDNEKLFSQVAAPQEAVMDAMLIKHLSRLCRQQAEQMSANMSWGSSWPRHSLTWGRTMASSGTWPWSMSSAASWTMKKSKNLVQIFFKITLGGKNRKRGRV